jgi:hypothetical protein
VLVQTTSDGSKSLNAVVEIDANGLTVFAEEGAIIRILLALLERFRLLLVTPIRTLIYNKPLSAVDNFTVQEAKLDRHAFLSKSDNTASMNSMHMITMTLEIILCTSIH